NDDIEVSKNFDVLMWVCVSDSFVVNRIIFQIVEVASKPYIVEQNSSLDALKSLLDQKLHGKRFLLVLDDVWNENLSKWKVLRDYLFTASSDKESKGSKIMVTTRSKNVASIMGSNLQFELKPFDKGECWKLFVKFSFQEAEKEAEEYPRLKKIGKNVVQKCNGIPLAIVTLGCLLRSKSHDENEWKKISDSEMWELDQENNAILPSLRLSYNYLPPELKQCFSYCSCFPKDYPFVVIELIMFWMAHGLLQPTREDEDVEDIGEFYIKIEASFSFFASN
ncbi:putative disease resistance protein RGA3, partial [Arachis duranensis]|uniref:Disease resistance protein RGA3 n=1 Tax=Arachis duranensis TaxID=130453 RepID=A0A6P4C0Z0_ARADU